ncbi:MAG TPA: hypothetical protein VN714_16325 [Trebonia sp.]|jgi:hypothetical protein|nr:hypothetical protein [Trebonia sp.]
MSGEGNGAASGREPDDSGKTGQPEDPAGLLDEMRALRRRTRTARHAYWFPLVLFGLLTCLSAPFYVQWGNLSQAGATAGGGVPFAMLGGFPAITTQRYLGYFWLVALLGGLLLTLLWYRWNARRVGLQTPARGYIVTTAVLTVLAVVLPPLSQVSWLRFLSLLWPGDLVIRGTFPFVIIAVGLWVLAWAERSRALTVIAAVYTATALLAALYNVENVVFRLGWNPSGWQWRLTTLPNVLLPALVLLIAGTAAFAAQRHRAGAQA